MAKRAKEVSTHPRNEREQVRGRILAVKKGIIVEDKRSYNI
jgi:hypothetical protein